MYYRVENIMEVYLINFCTLKVRAKVENAEPYPLSGGLRDVDSRTFFKTGFILLQERENHHGSSSC